MHTYARAHMYYIHMHRYIVTVCQGGGEAPAFGAYGKVGDVGAQCSLIRLWNCNGVLLNKMSVDGTVTCVAFSNATEGIYTNFIVGGLANGRVKLWNTRNLRELREMQQVPINTSNETLRAETSPMTAVAVAPDGAHIYGGNQRGIITTWSRVSKRQSNISNIFSLSQTL